jgi:DNA-binding GntR family transcriptional regulator
VSDIEIRPASNSPTLASGIAARLRALITSGEMPPGKKLRLDDLRSTFGVSLSPLRESLSRLAAEGFVVLEDQRGYRVAPVSEANLREVIRLRAEVESLALRESIRLGDDDWESEVVAAAYRLKKSSRLEVRLAHPQEWEVAHRVLHERLLSACEMPLLLQFCGTLHHLSDRYRRIFLEDHPTDLNTAAEHASICSATVERRTEDACRLLRAHIERTGNNVLKALSRREARDKG